MIVSPDFLDDWKMTMLSDALGRDPAAPVYVLRLWSHCQQKKAWQFDDIPALALSSVCKAPHDGKVFFDAMVLASYVEPMGDGFAVPGWADLNGQLIAAWTNGKAGGRPTKVKPPKPARKPSGIPTPPPTDTRGQPDGKPIGEDKKNPRVSGDTPPPLPPAPPPRPEKKPVEAAKPPAAPTPATSPPPAPPAPATPPAGPKPKGMDLFGDDDQPGRKPKPPELPSAAGFPCPDGVSPGMWAEFLAYRLSYSLKNKKAPYTAQAMRGVVNTYLKRCIATGESGDDALQRAMAQGWSAPYPDPYLERVNRQKLNPTAGARMSQRDIDAERGRALAGEQPPPPRGAPNEANHRRTGDIEDVEWRDGPATTRQ